MIPTQIEKQSKRSFLINEEYDLQFDSFTNKTTIHITDLHSILEDYAKWHTTEIIKYCAEKASENVSKGWEVAEEQYRKLYGLDINEMDDECNLISSIIGDSENEILKIIDEL